MSGWLNGGDGFHDDDFSATASDRACHGLAARPGGTGRWCGARCRRGRCGNRGMGRALPCRSGGGPARAAASGAGPSRSRAGGSARVPEQSAGAGLAAFPARRRARRAALERPCRGCPVHGGAAGAGARLLCSRLRRAGHDGRTGQHRGSGSGAAAGLHGGTAAFSAARGGPGAGVPGAPAQRPCGRPSARAVCRHGRCRLGAARARSGRAGGAAARQAPGGRPARCRRGALRRGGRAAWSAALHQRPLAGGPAPCALPQRPRHSWGASGAGGSADPLRCRSRPHPARRPAAGGEHAQPLGAGTRPACPAQLRGLWAGACHHHQGHALGAAGRCERGLVGAPCA